MEPAQPVEARCVSFLQVQQRSRNERSEIAVVKHRRNRGSRNRQNLFDAELRGLEVVSVDDPEGYPEVGVVVTHGSVGVGGEDPELNGRVQAFEL